MPKTITHDALDIVLHTGDFDQLLGVVEDEFLDFKEQPYQLVTDANKMEFAKDVSALANSFGGNVIIGVGTHRDPTHLGDQARRIGIFEEKLINRNQYHQILDEWIYPPIKDLAITWYPSNTNNAKGIVAIKVGKSCTETQPHIVVKALDPDGKSIGAYIGYFERLRDGAVPTSPTELRTWINDGRRFSRLNNTLESLQAMVSKLTSGKSDQPSAAVPDDTIRSRVANARTALEYNNQPTFFLTATATGPVEMKSLFAGRDDDLVHLLENPPRLRTDGFNFPTGRESELLHAKLRRCIDTRRRLLEIWKDGVILAVLAGDARHLCYGMHSTEETGLRINSVALTETTYLFADFALRAYQHAMPKPSTIKVRIGFSNMTVNDRPCLFNPSYPTLTNLDEGKEAGNDQFTFEQQVDLATTSPGSLAFELLSDFHAWFHYDESSIEYATPGQRFIDPATITH